MLGQHLILNFISKKKQCATPAIRLNKLI